ncbi:uncharacterized protein LOC135160656 [Diachasmimorpha longicaudata]|uniref:uncharacterized protein LOC135160656 n=1 Tax=Diachasmimorpha longicaudata TaxID=58733 RepID=UPI0030B878C9
MFWVLFILHFFRVFITPVGIWRISTNLGILVVKLKALFLIQNYRGEILFPIPLGNSSPPPPPPPLWSTFMCQLDIFKSQFKISHYRDIQLHRLLHRIIREANVNFGMKTERIDKTHREEVHALYLYPCIHMKIYTLVGNERTRQQSVRRGKVVVWEDRRAVAAGSIEIIQLFHARAPVIGCALPRHIH